MVQDPAQALLAWFADLPPGVDRVRRVRGARRQDDRPRPRRGAGWSRATSAARGSRRLAENLRRAGSGREHAVVADARRPPVRPVGAVLLDAPCLGTGTLRPAPRRALAGDARGAGDAGRRARPSCSTRPPTAVAPGGLLLYATCSLEPEENGEQVERFLARHPEFRREPAATFPADPASPEGRPDDPAAAARHGRRVRRPAPAGP